MRIWNYHPVTGELLGSSVADPNPVEEGEWLTPAFATDVAPPDAQPGRALVWLGGSWDSAPDHRGETWWQADAEFNDEPYTIDALGDPKDHGLTNVEPPAPPAPPEPPFVVSPRQIRLALSQLGHRAELEAAVAVAGQDVMDTWAFASKFERNGMIRDVLVGIGKTPEEVDALFDLAKTL